MQPPPQGIVNKRQGTIGGIHQADDV